MPYNSDKLVRDKVYKVLATRAACVVDHSPVVKFLWLQIK